MIAHPNTVKVSAVSIAIKPVTQTALVDVNSAFIKDTFLPSFIDIGSINNIVPNNITIKKPNTMILPGLIFLINLKF